MLKRLLAATAAAALLVGGLSLEACAPPKPKVSYEAVKVHHMTHGRYAFQDSDGVWWWYVYANGATSSDTGSLASAGSWSRGESPLASDLADLVEDLAITVPETASGQPMTEAQASAYESPASEAGGDSASFDGPSDSSPSVDAGAGDSGGGGDGGGGGE